MSRTDAHRPYRVQETDPAARHHFYRYEGRLVPLHPLCGCAMCTDHHGRRVEIRRERTHQRSELARVRADHGYEPRRRIPKG